MANRHFRQFPKTLIPEVCKIYARVSFGASGAPTLDAKNSKGVVSVTRNSAGKFTFVFGTNTKLPLDTYNRLLMIKHVFDETGNSGTAPASPALYIIGNSIATVGTASIQVEFNNAGTATDPASGEVVLLQFVFQNSTAP